MVACYCWLQKPTLAMLLQLHAGVQNIVRVEEVDD